MLKTSQGLRVAGVGPKPCTIMIVGEAPGEDEIYRGEPFVGASGQELSKMLNEAGIIRASCYITNVCRSRPPKNDITLYINERSRALLDEEKVQFRDRVVLKRVFEDIEQLRLDIEEAQPNVIIALGDTAMWALTSRSGITSWRGSMLVETLTARNTKVIPTYHPAAILRMWNWRAIALHDLRRAAKESATPRYTFPNTRFTIRPDYSTTITTIAALVLQADEKQQRSEKLPLAVDIETRGGNIACVGIAWSNTDAICIPFLSTSNSYGYWGEDYRIETNIVLALRTLLTHPAVSVVGQNFLYDAQYFASRWFFIPRVTDDTMFQQHVAFVGMPKALYFLASLYCEHYVYWKDDGKLWDVTMSEEQLWKYNCMDAIATFEVFHALNGIIDKLKLRPQYEFQMQLWKRALRMMLRGIRIDKAKRDSMGLELIAAAQAREDFITHVVGYALNPRSPKQMHHFLYNEMRLPPVMNRKTHKITANFEALQKCADKEPLLRPLLVALLEQRSISTYLSTFILSKLDADGRMRCTMNPAGTESYRLASSESAFGTGMNMQNIPYETRKAAKDGKVGLHMQMPNVRELFIPDPNFTIADVDLDRADLQVVVWEADDAELKQALRLGVDLHILNGASLHNRDLPMDELVESHPNYPEHRARWKRERQFAKNFIHGTNYGGSPKTMAAVSGVSVHEAERFQRRWFQMHPGIAQWHERTQMQLMTRRFVENRFGYRRYYFDRVDGLLPEALAWIPQSTVACVINRAWDRLDEHFNEHTLNVLIQVHDSLVFQYRTATERVTLHLVHNLCQIPIPYDDPLTIPVGLKTSKNSWGECTPRDWPQAV